MRPEKKEKREKNNNLLFQCSYLWRRSFLFPFKISRSPLIFSLFSLFFFLFSFSINAQEVSASIDTTSISIGEQIKYRISVETNASDSVVFPQEQTFLPLEMVEAYEIDTSTIDSGLRLLKEYALTKFDSGTYVIPAQRVMINNREVLTDSFLLDVRGVQVDTTQQKMYPIKPSLDVPEPFRFPTWIWWVLGGLLVLGGIFFLVRRKKKKAAERNIPPYEKAMLSLKQLDEGDLLEDREIKNYYSILTDTARKYLDEKVDDRAMESTTSELIVRLQMRKDAGKLTIEQEIIDDFERILKRADLAKFARSRPGIITAKEDRGHIEKIINDTDHGIPEPTEEELQKDEAYRKQYAKRQKRKRIITWSLSIVALLAIIVAVLVTTKGTSFVKDSIFGNTTKELLNSEWISSEYGNPPVYITTPKVLVRMENDSIQKSTFGRTAVETFSSGDLFGEFYTILSTSKVKKQAAADPNTNATDSKKAFEALFANLGTDGAQNIVVKQEEFTTAKGVKGKKIMGSFSVKKTADEEGIQKEYILLNFAKNEGLQQVLLVFNKGDDYAPEIASRIIYSIELQNPGN